MNSQDITPEKILHEMDRFIIRVEHGLPHVESWLVQHAIAIKATLAHYFEQQRQRDI